MTEQKEILPFSSWCDNFAGSDGSKSRTGDFTICDFLGRRTTWFPATASHAESVFESSRVNNSETFNPDPLAAAVKLQIVRANAGAFSEVSNIPVYTRTGLMCDGSWPRNSSVKAPVSRKDMPPKLFTRMATSSPSANLTYARSGSDCSVRYLTSLPTSSSGEGCGETLM